VSIMTLVPVRVRKGVSIWVLPGIPQPGSEEALVLICGDQPRSEPSNGIQSTSPNHRPESADRNPGLSLYFT